MSRTDGWTTQLDQMCVHAVNPVGGGAAAGVCTDSRAFGTLSAAIVY